jgi:hypothetical protein
MLSLANDQLQLDLLDPVADRARLGSRYCTGGYVYTVTDRRLGVITSGPGYPDEVNPPVFDGQGLPEAFPTPLWLGGEAAAPNVRPEPGTRMLVIGVGMVTATTAEQWRVMPVDEWCSWQISTGPQEIQMTTSQAYAGWSLDLTRKVTLFHRTVGSETILRNAGDQPISFRWFPHPFFPNPRGECCRFNLAVAAQENPGYVVLPNGFLETKLDHEWDRVGHFLALDYEAGDKLVTVQRHPTLGLLVAQCSYTPSWLPVWGNKNTFSFEPYLSTVVEAGASASWSIIYDF